MTTVIDCPKGAEGDLASLYVSGKLGDEEAAAFEEHFFACESCREDVERGSELRAVFGKVPIVPATSGVRSGRTWIPLAAAAVIAFVGIGVWQLARRAADEAGRPVMRSSRYEFLEVKVVAGPSGSIELTWPPPSGAASYAVQVLAADDTSVWKKQTNEPRMTIGSAVLPAVEGDKALLVEVEALDVMGQTIARSERAPLPKRW